MESIGGEHEKPCRDICHAIPIDRGIHQYFIIVEVCVQELHREPSSDMGEACKAE